MPLVHELARLIGAIGFENIMFEAAGPRVFPWSVQHGPEGNCSADHSQNVQRSTPDILHSAHDPANPYPVNLST